MNLKASIVICAYNSVDRIGSTLEALATQTASDGSFELIVVDNASSDGTGDFVRNHVACSSLSKRNINCQVIREQRQGLTYARIRGVCESKGSFVCFLDDDNLPQPDYIAQGLSAFSDDSIGILVSRIYPKYLSVNPSPSMLKREHLLAINNKMGEDLITWEGTSYIAPTIGAGMWLRRSAFLDIVPWQSPELLMGDRTGTSLLSGGDIEIGILFARANFKRLYCPGLVLYHLIPPTRLTRQYFTRLIISIIRSELTLKKKYYDQQYGILEKIKQFFILIFAMLAFPVIILRQDGLNEFLFVLAGRWARFLGPFF